MAISLITTPAFVLDYFDIGEANRYFKFFTKEKGLIGAAAQGARSLSSRRRGHLSRYSFVEAGFVRGRIWRLASVREIFNPVAALRSRHDSEKTKIFARLSALLSRMLQGEEKNERLFDIFYASFCALAASPDLKFAHSAERITALRILAILGHIGAESEIAAFLKRDDFGDDLIENAWFKRSVVTDLINHAIKESQL